MFLFYVTMATKTSNGLEFTKNILFKASFLMSGKQMCNRFYVQ